MRTLFLSLTLAALACLSGCASRGIPQPTATMPDARADAVLQAAADAHGLARWREVRDISVAYAGEWYGLVSRLQPTLIDPAFRQGSEERLLIGRPAINAQLHRGPGGEKWVRRGSGADIAVAYNGQPADDPDVRAAAALVADGYRLFLTGPFYFLEGTGHLEWLGRETVDDHACDVLLAIRRPGHGLSPEDRYLLFIDTTERLLRRVRFTMEGLASTQGAVAEVDFFDHRRIDGIVWPTRFYERLRQPIPNLPVHDWRLIGLDLNRGLTAEELQDGLRGRAAAPARRLAEQP